MVYQLGWLWNHGVFLTAKTGINNKEAAMVSAVTFDARKSKTAQAFPVDWLPSNYSGLAVRVTNCPTLMAVESAFNGHGLELLVDQEKAVVAMIELIDEGEISPEVNARSNTPLRT